MNINGTTALPLNTATSSISSPAQRIASGKQINSAADDAAGLAISNRLSAEISGFAQANRNANDGVSYLQVSDGALASLTESVQRIRELALQASNGTLTNQDRSSINKEAQALKEEINQQVNNTQFNGISVLANEQDVSIQLGSGKEDTLTISNQDFRRVLEDISFEQLDLSSASSAQASISTLDTLQSSIDNNSANIGAQSNRLDSAISTLFNSEISASASRSRIEDADIAKQSTELAAKNLKENIAISLQAQANAQQPQILKLLESL